MYERTTRDIRVVVRPRYLESQSRPDEDHFVWAYTIEEAEGLAALALQEEGLQTITADAKKCSPAAAPKRAPMAVARTDLRFLPRIDGETVAEGPSRRDARA